MDLFGGHGDLVGEAYGRGMEWGTKQAFDAVVPFGRDEIKSQMKNMVNRLGSLFHEGSAYENVEPTWDADRVRLEKSISEAKGELDAGEDPRSITDAQALACLPHKVLWENTCGANGIRSDMVDHAADGWKMVATELTEGIADFQKVVDKTVGDAWQGKTADKVGEDIALYAKSTHKLAKSAQVIQFKLQTLKSALDETRKYMPPPGEDPAVPGFVPFQGFLKKAFSEKQASEAAARRLMAQVYAPVVDHTDTGVPVLPKPPQVVHGPGQSGGGGFGSAAGGSTGGGGGGFGGGSGAATPKIPAPTGTEGAAAAGQPAEPPKLPETGLPGGEPAPAKPEASVDPDQGTIASAATTGPHLGTGGAGGGFGGGAGGGAGASTPPPAPPGAHPGPQLGATPGTLGGKPAAPGTPSGPPGLPGMPGGKKEAKDNEHRSADYLRSTKHLEEFFAQGGVPDKAPPPVLEPRLPTESKPEPAPAEPDPFAGFGDNETDGELPAWRDPNSPALNIQK